MGVFAVSDGFDREIRRYYGLVVMAVLVLGVYAWASRQSMFAALSGVLPL